MQQSEKLTICRYYRGEQTSPYSEQNKSMLWFYERCWVNEKNGGLLSEYIFEYRAAGLSEFCNSDNIPISLKALLFNRYSKTAWSLRDAAEPFKKFYLKYYG